MKEQKVYIIYHEKLWQSVLSDMFTFGTLSLCIWFSAGDKFWSFVCVVMFLFWISAKSKIIAINEFRTKKALKHFVDELQDDDESEGVK
jgi:hypothetical protein